MDVFACIVFLKLSVFSPSCLNILFDYFTLLPSAFLCFWNCVFSPSRFSFFFGHFTLRSSLKKWVYLCLVFLKLCVFSHSRFKLFFWPFYSTLLSEKWVFCVLWFLNCSFYLLLGLDFLFYQLSLLSSKKMCSKKICFFRNFYIYLQNFLKVQHLLLKVN
jgi:hypothetical protein